MNSLKWCGFNLDSTALIVYVLVMHSFIIRIFMYLHNIFYIIERKSCEQIYLFMIMIMIYHKHWIWKSSTKMQDAIRIVISCEILLVQTLHCRNKVNDCAYQIPVIPSACSRSQFQSTNRCLYLLWYFAFSSVSLYNQQILVVQVILRKIITQLYNVIKIYSLWCSTCIACSLHKTTVLHKLKRSKYKHS